MARKPTIGWVVAGSLMCGFIAALALVALPFAGAQAVRSGTRLAVR